MLKLRSLLAFSFCLLFGSAALAQTGPSGTLYFGAGTNNESDALEIDETPFVIGALFFSGPSLVYGFDLASEGQMLDSTYGTNELRQAFSFNGLIGANVVQTTGFRADIAAILGFKESFADCPDSFLGFQCYADQEPETEYEFNFGAMINFTFDAVSFGVRATDVSTQAVFGINF